MHIIQSVVAFADVVKLVDTTDSKSVASRRGGSSPPIGTIIYDEALIFFRAFVLSSLKKFLFSSILLQIYLYISIINIYSTIKP